MGKFEIVEFVPEKSSHANEWIEDITALAEATEQNPNAAATFPIAWAKRNTDMLAIREAAKTLGKTVRVRKEDVTGLKAIGTKDNGKTVYEGDIVYTISLTDKYKDGRGRKGGAKPETEAEAEAPAKSK